MAVSLSPLEAKRLERRQRLMLDLPTDFLRIPNQISSVRPGPILNANPNLSQQQIENLDQQTAVALHQQLNVAGSQTRGQVHGIPVPAPAAVQNIRGRLLVSVMQAKLVKNYGMTRMDPYVRLHIGHGIYETPTDVNGSKSPRWNKTIQSYLPNGITTVYLEIYDECSFSVDERIAHAHIPIPEQIFKGETIEEWYLLNGKQGDAKEGQILLVFSFMANPVGMMGPPNVIYAPGIGTGGYQYPKKGPIVYQSGQPVQSAVVPPLPTFSEQDFKQLVEMFPNVEEEVVKSIYEVSAYSKETAVNTLLGMSD